MERTLDRLREAADALEARGLPDRNLTTRVLRNPYEPWWAQRMMHRPAYDESGPLNVRYRVLVAGRQSGKTWSAAQELLWVMTEKPGSFSILLAPTYQIARAAIRTVVDAAKAADLPHVWKEQKKELHLPNGSVWAVFSADRSETVRGPTITGLFWVDEGAYLGDKAWTAALGALAAVKDKQVLITTTPAGKNWVFDEFTNPDNRAIRFKTEDSPHTDQEGLSELRSKMSSERAQQEFDAIFVDSLLLAFPDRSTLWVDSFPERDDKQLDNALGIDLGKEQDYVVVTLMNKFGEGNPLARWRRTDWPTTIQRLAQYCLRHAAIPVIDQGHGGGYGGVVKDFLERDHGIEAMMVNTGSRGKKGEIVEAARADVHWGRVRLLKTQAPAELGLDNTPLWQVYDDEMAKFQMLKKVVQGQEITVFEGPQREDEHDDCPISFALANWGRLHAWADVYRNPRVDLGSFVKASKGRKGSGYHWNPFR